MENFKTGSNNQFLLKYYRAQYQGISRCNVGINNIPQIAEDSIMSTKVKARLLGEVHFLRALYYFRLVRIFGGVPLVDYVIDSSNKWKQPRASIEEIYDFIVSDLKIAEKQLWYKSEYTKDNLGRATKGAAQAMLMKVNLYRHNYEEALKWGNSFFEKEDEYSLCENYADNFSLDGENGPESVFEIQYMQDPTSDYGEGNGFTRGTFTVIMTRSRSAALGGGWGFNKPTQDLYNEFESGDIRREATILNPTDNQMETPEQEIYLNCRYLSRKYMLMNNDGSFYTLTHNSRAPINIKMIRYSDVLLMYAEAACEANRDLEMAQRRLNQVRERVNLPTYDTSLNQTELRRMIRHERRTELAMEGHRWFDLCRWGIAKQTIDKYRSNESSEVQNHMGDFIEGKHELFPIPNEEINLGGLTQNNGYN